MIRKLLLLIFLYFAAPRESFWRDVGRLEDEGLRDEIALIKSVPTHYTSIYSDFYCDPVNGSNLNGGSGVPGTESSPTMSDTAGTGSWTSTTNVYVSVATSGAVAVGQFMSIYSSGATIPAYTARITTVTGGGGSAWTITLSSTAIAGAKPTTASTYFAKVGGSWLGPNGTAEFPINYITATLTDAAGDTPRVNLLNSATYSITAAMSHTLLGPMTWQGYTSTPGDGGKANIDGGTSGTSYVLLTLSGSGVVHELWDIVFSNNGATGSANGIVAADPRNTLHRCVVHDIRGNGIAFARAYECEAYLCNKSNTASTGGFFAQASGNYKRCIAHDNSGSNNCGFYDQTGSTVYENCIADTNGLYGFFFNNLTNFEMRNCDVYGNVNDGVHVTSGTGRFYIENCNFVLNGTGATGYGINIASGTYIGYIANCGFGSGTQVNTSGQTNGTGKILITGSVTYAANVTPWNAPATGDFTITLAAAKNTGRGTFTETQSSYTGAIGYPDIGSNQHLDAGGSTVIIVEDD